MEKSNSPLIRIIATMLFCSSPLMLFCQESGTCAENLKTAQSLFEKGQVELVPGTLKDCMKSGFKREENLTAYKLLIQSFLFEDNTSKADSTMLTFLKNYPEYQISPTDHSSFVFLFNSFKVRPVLELTFHFGTSLPFITSVKQVSLSSAPAPDKYSTNFLNIFMSLEAKFPINKKFEVNVEGGYSQLQFTKTEAFMGFGTIKYIETQQRLEIPVSVSYNIITIGKFTPYIRAGIGAALDLSSSAKTTFTPYNGSGIRSGADVSRNDSRISTDVFAQAGVGIKFKTPGGFISLEARSNLGLFDQTVRGGNSSEILEYPYYYADDDFKLNDLVISLGYTQIFYKPTKRK
ncbi:MAG: outer membrane beta-barrel protein [Bacteroidales bacterium]|jgi:hypothetical protein